MGKVYALVIYSPYSLANKSMKYITTFALRTLSTEYKVAKFYRSIIELSRFNCLRYNDHPLNAKNRTLYKVRFYNNALLGE